MFPWSLIGTALKTGAEIYQNKKKSEIIMSEARIVHAEKMKRGEIEYSGQIAQNQKGDWKDEFVLLVLTRFIFSKASGNAMVDSFIMGICRCSDIWNQSN
jgi:hypothetical protein